MLDMVWMLQRSVMHCVRAEDDGRKLYHLNGIDNTDQTQVLYKKMVLCHNIDFLDYTVERVSPFKACLFITVIVN